MGCPKSKNPTAADCEDCEMYNDEDDSCDVANEEAFATLEENKSEEV